METTRQRIADHLRGAELQPSAIAEREDLTPSVVVEHVQHIARSLDGTDEQLLVAPPRCLDCGFDGFDEPANLPSRCPDCHSERLAEPTFTIR